MPEPRPLLGVSLMLSAVFCFALLDATSKHLSQTFNVPLLVWARYGVHLLLMLVIFGASHGLRLVATTRPLAQIVRALLLVGVTGFAMAAFRVMPLAETTALLFVTPLIVALLAGPMLGEHVDLRRWLAAHGGIPKKPLIASMPISLRAAGNAEYTTQATLSLVNLHTHRADPVQRLHAIRDGALAVKTLAQRARGVIPTDFPSIGSPWLLHSLATLYGRSGAARAVPPIANVVISNVPGPADKHRMTALSQEVFRVVSVFTPPIAGNETHDADNSYAASGPVPPRKDPDVPHIARATCSKPLHPALESRRVLHSPFSLPHNSLASPLFVGLGLG